MRYNTSTRGLLALSALIHLSTALPFFHRETVPLKALIRRATYSVVPVDGGAAQTDAPEETVVETIVRTQPARTKTVIQTDNVTPTVTDYIQTTISTPKETQTVVVVVTPIPTVLTTTSYSIIGVETPSFSTTIAPSSTSSSNAPSTTNISPPKISSSPILSEPALTSTSSESLSSSLASSTTSTLEIIPSPTPTSPSESITSPTLVSSTILSTSSESSVTITSSSSASLATITSTSISTTKTFDDGLWKTIYPAWNDTRTVGAYIRAVRVLPTPVPAALS